MVYLICGVLFFLSIVGFFIGIIWSAITFFMKKDRKKPLITTGISFALMIICGGISLSANPIYTDSDIEAAYADADNYYAERIEEIESSYEAEYEALSQEKESIEAEYENYKESMASYEGLAEAEAQARQIEAESIAESQALAESQAEAESIAARNEAQKVLYDTGITYDQIARNPEDYEGKLVKFTGRVVQVLEGDLKNQIRLAVNNNFDNIVLGEYVKSIVPSRVLEDDNITIYGESLGLISYESAMGVTITIPSIKINKIDQ